MAHKKSGRRIIAVFIAYNAAKTLRKFYEEFPKHLVDEMILVDDASRDGTYELAKQLGITAYKNPVNLGYGGNMKRALALALRHRGDIFIDIHPDGEYKPTAIPAALQKVHEGAAFVVGDRFTTLDNPLKSGMYFWKFVPIWLLNAIDRLVLRVKIQDFHQGFRVYTKSLLEQTHFEQNSNNYLFSFELIAQAVFRKLPIAQVPVETHYTGNKRGASLKNSILYSLGTFKVLLLYLCAKAGFSIQLFKKPVQPLAQRLRHLTQS